MAITKQTSTEIILSGVEGERFMETAYTQGECRNMLMSILYIEAKGGQWFANRCQKYQDVKWMIDSGGHSFRKEGFCQKWPDWAWFDAFALRYRDWLQQNRDLISLAVNLDVDSLDPSGVGMQKVLEWDNDIFRPLERDGVPICYVWHEEWGYDFWLKMCREHEYVGLPGHLDPATYNRMLRPAIMNGNRVHGFALTKSGVMGKLPFASVDSTSWKAGERYGQTFVFEGTKLRVFDKQQKDQRLRYKSRWVSKGIDWDELQKDKAEEVTKVCAIAWADLQTHVRTLSTKLAYWLKTTALIDPLGDPANVTQEALSAALSAVEFPVLPESDVEARGFLRELKAFLTRDPIVMTYKDDVIDWWLEKLKLTPENDTRPEREATVRQGLYSFLYKITVEQAKERTKPEDVEPKVTHQARKDELPDAPTVTAELPDQPGAVASEPVHAPDSGNETEESDSRPPTVPTDSAPHAEVQVFDIEEFVPTFEDRIVASRCTLAFDLLFRQYQLKHKADTLKELGVLARRQRKLRSDARKMADEITELLASVDEESAETVRTQARAAYDAWVDAEGNEAAKEELERKTALSRRPQNQLTPEKARAMRAKADLRGNQNARKSLSVDVFSNSKTPKLACDNCPHIQVCPQYKEGHVCAFISEYEKEVMSAPDEEPQVTVLRGLLKEQLMRARRAVLFETFEGGMINKETSRVLRDCQAVAKDLHMALHPVQPFGAGNVPQAPAGDPAKPGALATIFAGVVKDADAEVMPSETDQAVTKQPESEQGDDAAEA